MARRSQWEPAVARHRGVRRVAIVAVVIAAVLGLVAGIAIAVPKLLDAFTGAASSVRSAQSAFCTAGGSYALSPEQARNASLIAGIAINRGMPDHAVTVALATAMQESKLTNLDHGDLDSVGLFQQRPSQGWGSQEQLMDESYATNAFYDELLKVADWQTIPVEDAAQAVQRSGYPELYADWDQMARAWASALTGEQAAGIACTLEKAQSSDESGLTAGFQAMFPSVAIARRQADGTSDDASDGTSDDASNGTSDGNASNAATLDLTLPDGLSDTDGERLCWQTASWLVAHARQYGVTAVHANGMDWTRASGSWSGTAAVERAVSVTLSRR